MQVRKRKNKKWTIFVAGESRTSAFTSTKSSDVFLLEVGISNGKPLVADLFGKDNDDGMNRANVDLHFTPDKNKFPLILANTGSWPIYGNNNPYLIERYDDIAEKCHHEVRDVPLKTYDFPRNKVLNKVYTTEFGEEKLKGYEEKIGGKGVCPKVATI